MPAAARIRRLRLVGLAEGVSFVVLGIAMVFKYGAGEPLGVRIAGPVHGGLFLLYLLAIAHAWPATRWPFTRVLLLFTAAVLPFGPFFCEPWLRREERVAADTPA